MGCLQPTDTNAEGTHTGKGLGAFYGSEADPCAFK